VNAARKTFQIIALIYAIHVSPNEHAASAKLLIQRQWRCHYRPQGLQQFGTHFDFLGAQPTLKEMGFILFHLKGGHLIEQIARHGIAAKGIFMVHAILSCV
jgi:hypothetical protein